MEDEPEGRSPRNVVRRSRNAVRPWRARRGRRTSRSFVSRPSSPTRISGHRRSSASLRLSPISSPSSPSSGDVFKQGTELVALQRGNLEMGNIAAQDISNQIPAWSIMTAGYMFRDADHLKKVFESDVGKEMVAQADSQLGVHILGPTYFGVRQVGLKPDKKINTPCRHGGH